MNIFEEAQHVMKKLDEHLYATCWKNLYGQAGDRILKGRNKYQLEERLEDMMSRIERMVVLNEVNIPDDCRGCIVSRECSARGAGKFQKGSGDCYQFLRKVRDTIQGLHDHESGLEKET